MLCLGRKERLDPVINAADALETQRAEFLQPLQLLDAQVGPDFAGLGDTVLLVISCTICIDQTMKRVKTIAHEKPEKKLGRPRTVSDNEEAPALGVRFRPGTYAQIERLAEASGKRKGDIVRDLVDEALAGRITDGMKRKKG